MVMLKEHFGKDSCITEQPLHGKGDSRKTSSESRNTSYSSLSDFSISGSLEQFLQQDDDKITQQIRNIFGFTRRIRNSF